MAQEDADLMADGIVAMCQEIDGPKLFIVLGTCVAELTRRGYDTAAIVPPLLSLQSSVERRAFGN